MSYVARPLEVEAFKITAVLGDGSKVTLDDGREIACAAEDEPLVGDYLVFWPDGEETLYPAEEFEGRFAPANATGDSGST